MKEVITTIGKQRIRLVILALLLFSFVGFNHLQSTEAASSSPYLIKVNKQQNCVTIYEKDSEGKYTVPVKAMICSTGVETPLGTFKTPTKYRWKVLLEDVWGQYSTRITQDILFHSVWYYKQDPSTLSALQYNKLGTMCSHGCIRLTVADAKWIYDNCPIGTTVTIYNSKDPGPLGKPTAIKLAPGTGWDPTDVTNKNNPFNSKNPKINGAKDVTVNFGSKVNLLKGITATNTTGYYITDRIEVNGSVDTKTPGTYRIKYTVTDEIGKTARKTITYTVRGDVSEPVLLGVADKVVNGNTEVNRDLALQGVTAKQGKQAVDSKNIVVRITDNKDNTYTVTYTLANKTSGKTATAEATIIVDSRAPEFTGVKDQEISWKTDVTKEFALKNVSVADNVSDMKQSDISVTIKKADTDTFTVVYTAKDEVGNKAIEKVTFTITDYLRIEGAQDQVIANTVILDEAYAKLDVLAYSKDVDVTASLKVTIVKTSDTTYDVTYLIEDELGHRKDVKVVFTVQQ
jgi:hypothetical protein